MAGKRQAILIEDVSELGRKGDLVSVTPGYLRNYLLPKKKAFLADARALRLREKLLKERELKSQEERKEAEAFALRLKEIRLKSVVKVDEQGHLYGSVGPSDVVDLLEAATGVKLEKKQVLLQQPIKTIGEHCIALRLREDVDAEVLVEVVSE